MKRFNQDFNSLEGIKLSVYVCDIEGIIMSIMHYIFFY